MATAAPPPLSSSGNKTNGAKLSRLLIDGGTTVLRNTFDGFHSPANLAANLNAKYAILNNLLRRRILNGAQWDKLFPPGGVPPDCKTFDITLLFVLLRNMCGLSPPPTGWDNMPLTSDTSLEANLVRIKYFRNYLYGHVATTGVDTPTFTALWLEISVVLVSLGLDQAEIDRLKAEHCGEDDYLDVLFEWVKSEEDIKSILKEAEKTQNKTQQGVEKANEKLTQMQQSVSEVHQTQEEDHEMIHQLKHKIEKGQEASAQTLEEIKKLHKYQHEQKQAKEKERADEVLKNLAKSEFKGDIEYHSNRFQAGTREWVFEAVVDWLDDRSSQHRVMVISGNAGIGKSVISSVISKRMQEAGRLAGSHFCQHNNVRYHNPQLMLQSLACHLCCTLPEYKSALVEKLSRNVGVELNSMGIQDLFALLFKEPLSTLSDPERNILIVIDGLDESEYEGRSELLDVVSNQFCRLPGWIRLLVTSRPERNIAECLKGLNPLLLKPTLAKNFEDVQLFFDKQLRHVMRQEHVGAILKELVRKSEGVFLYAYFLVEYIEKNVSCLDLEHLESSLPLGVSSVYLSYFKRLESEVCKELKNGEEKVLNLLCAVTAAREPLPLSFVSRMLSPNTSSVTARRVVNKVICCVSALLPIHNDRLYIFHKSVKDWLTDISSYGEHDFTVDEKEGHQILSKLCADELDEVKRRGVHSTEFSATEQYALQHGVSHMVEVDKESRPSTIEALVGNYVTDLELLYAKLCVNCEAGHDDIIHVKKAKRLESLSEEIQNTLMELLGLLSRNYITLRVHPRTVFHDVLNDGGPQLSLKAAEFFRKYPGIPYMEFLHGPRTVSLDVLNEEGPQPSLKAAEILCKFPGIPYMEYVDNGRLRGPVGFWDEVTDVVFSLDGANAYVIWRTADHVEGLYKTTGVAVLDVLSRKFKEQNRFTRTYSFLKVIPVKSGVLLLRGNQSPELWNGDVTQRVQTFSQFSNIDTAVSVSEEVVACGGKCRSGFKVDVLNTSSREILSSSVIPGSGDVRLLGCNSQYQSLICTSTSDGFFIEPYKLRCWDKASELWGVNVKCPEKCCSLRDDFVVIWKKGRFDNVVHVLDARTGATLHTLSIGHSIDVCAFISDGESLVCCDSSLVWLFNVRSGELLSELDFREEISFVSACRQNPLIAVGARSSGFKLFRVHLPRLEESSKKNGRKSKGLREEDDDSIKGKFKNIAKESINLEAATGTRAKDLPPKLSFTLPRLSDLQPLSKPWNEVKLPIDALLLTVNDCEFVSCYVYLKDRVRSYYRGLGYVYFGTIGECQVTVALLKCGSASPGGSLIVVKNAAGVLRPKLVISVGTCGSLRPKEAKLGDVVLAAKLTTYARKEVRNDRVVPCGVRTLCSRDTADLIKHAAFGWKAPLENPKAREITVHSDSEVLSGPELVNSGWRREELIEQHPTATAIEMEGEGVFSAAYDLNMEWLVVKGVSNHADGTETETAPWKTFASVMAASIVCHMLKDPVVLRDWPVLAESSNKDKTAAKCSCFIG